MNDKLISLYGWFSEKQAQQNGTATYIALNGKEVVVSEVSSTPVYPPGKTAFDDDRKYIGQLLHCVHSNINIKRSRQ